MKFLIDECLHTSLVNLARQAGYLCEHATFLRLGSHKDWQLMTRIRRDEYTFVTNNRTNCIPD
jgi:predicted nuclease of predicted toxin-antitoxin system